MVWDIKEDCPLPIILGKPFLTTSHVLCDLEREELYLHPNKKQVKFNFDHSMQFMENEESVRIDLSLLANGVKGTIHMQYEDEEVSLDTMDDKPLQSSQTSPKSLARLYKWSSFL